jgi:phage major head subunit gpT-like protein
MTSFNPSSMLKAAKTTFAMNYNPDMDLVSKLCYRIISDSNNEDHPWAGQPPQMEEFVDEVKFTGMSDAVVNVENKIWTAGLQFRRQDIDDQKSAILDMRVRQLSGVAGGHVNKLLTQFITNGATSGYNSYDAVSYFNSTHPVRSQESGTQSNNVSTTGTTTSALTTDLSSAIAKLQNFEAENGDPFWGDVTPQLYVMCPPALSHNFREVLNAAFISQTENVYRGVAELIVNPRLTATSASVWYLFGATDAIKPFVFQLRDPIEFHSQDASQESDTVFSKELYRYKTRGRYNFGYGYWQCGVKVA